MTNEIKTELLGASIGTGAIMWVCTIDVRLAGVMFLYQISHIIMWHHKHKESK